MNNQFQIPPPAHTSDRAVDHHDLCSGAAQCMRVHARGVGMPLRVLVACEFSGIVRDAFIARGADAMSCDLLPTEKPGPHFDGDVREVLDWGWDLLIAHPPCTHLAVSGARHFAAKQASGVQQDALAFVRMLMAAPVPHIAIENPVSIISTRIRKPDQIIQPWQFGHGETKATCLWLKNLPRLVPTQIVDGRANRIHRMPPGPDRWKERSRTYQGIADAMADQWIRFLCTPAPRSRSNQQARSVGGFGSVAACVQTAGAINGDAQ